MQSPVRPAGPRAGEMLSSLSRIFQIIAGKRMELITTPHSPPSQGGDKVEVKNLLKEEVFSG